MLLLVLKQIDFEAFGLFFSSLQRDREIRLWTELLDFLSWSLTNASVGVCTRPADKLSAYFTVKALVTFNPTSQSALPGQEQIHTMHHILSQVLVA